MATDVLSVVFNWNGVRGIVNEREIVALSYVS